MPNLPKIEKGRRSASQARRLRQALALRAAGHSWSEIGTRLKISRQAASQLVKKYERSLNGARS